MTLAQGSNVVNVVATDTTGKESTASVTTTLDTTPPSLDVTAPLAGQIVAASPAAVMGTAGDDSRIARVTVNGVPAQLANEAEFTASFSAHVALNPGGNSLLVTATDRAGNTTSRSVQTTYDDAAPAVSITAPASGLLVSATTVRVTGTASDNIALTSLVVNDRDVALSGGVFSADVPLAEGENLIRAVATDVSGRQTTAAVTVTRDTTPPVVNIASPTPGQTLRATPATISGTVADAGGVTAVLVNGAPASVSGGGFTAQVALAPGDNTVTVAATDRAGNSGSASVHATFDDTPRLSIVSPAAGQLLNAQPVTVEGTIDLDTATVTVNGVSASVGGGRFVATGVPIPRDGMNTISAVGVAPSGRSGQASAVVMLDTAPPELRINSHADGQTVSDATVAVAGLVSDVSTPAPVVTVNGVTAAVSNGTFFAVGVPLAAGANQLTATATDMAGNTRSFTITLNRAEQPGLRLSVLSGQGQSGPINSVLPETLAVRLTDGFGDPVGNREVVFRVAQGDGRISTVAPAGPAAERTLILRTDGDGLAAVQFTLGSRTGAGNNRVQASVAGGLASVDFRASALGGAPDRVALITMSNQQSGVVGRPLAAPFAAAVLDVQGNPVAGVPVTFRVVEGGGSFDGGQSVTVNTMPNGKAMALLTLGPEPGTENNVVTAAFEGQTDPPVQFVASGLVPVAGAGTTFSGLVLDNGDRPLRNARVVIAGTSRQAFTGADGRFLIDDVPRGAQVLFINGSTIDDPAGRIFPGLEFDLNVIAGVENSLPMPIYLPPPATEASNPESVETITGPVTTAVVLQMPGVPEATLMLAPGTVVSNRTGPASASNPITVRLSRVNNDRVPMPPPNGSAFTLAGTIQPAGTHFDPPARVCVPNTGMPPGAQVDIFSFDHDVGMFLLIGPATVSEDGALLCSDPGFGIHKAGWWGGAPPPPPTTDPMNCRVTSVTASHNPLVIPDGSTMTADVTITATVDPADKTVTWGGDLGTNPAVNGNTVTTRYETPGEKMVTATCEQSSQSVKVKVNKVGIEINNTPAQDDDITLFNSAATPPAYTQTIQARVTLEGPAATVQMDVLPAGRGTLDRNSLNLPDNGNDTITLTPNARSAAANDVNIRARIGGVEADREDMTVVSVGIPAVRRANTPGGMADRIPPRVDTQLRVTVEPSLGASGQLITLATLNGNANNGTVTIDGNATLNMTATANVNFRGGTQTAPGSNGNLRAGARVRGQDTAQTAGFTVSSIVVNFRQTGVSNLPNGVLRFTYAWDSDSGALGDLDQVWVGEYVTYSDGGVHVGAGRPWRANNPDPTILPPRARPAAASAGRA